MTCVYLLKRVINCLDYEHDGAEDPIESAPFIIRAQARKAQGLIVFVRILFIYFLSTIRAFLGGLTWSKTLENVHTHWNPRQLERR